MKILFITLFIQVVLISNSIAKDEYQNSIDIQNKAFEQADAMYRCSESYIEKNLSPELAASSVAEASIAACNQYLSAYETYLFSSKLVILGKKSKTFEELDINTDKAEAEAKLNALELRENVRVVGIKYANDLITLANKKKNEDRKQPELHIEKKQMNL